MSPVARFVPLTIVQEIFMAATGRRTILVFVVKASHSSKSRGSASARNGNHLMLFVIVIDILLLDGDEEKLKAKIVGVIFW